MMRALTVKQPWAHLIMFPYLDIGVKTIENRSWATAYRGELLIHASANRDRELCLDVGVTSAIIGVVDLVDAHREESGCCPHPDRWWAQAEAFHWVLRNPRPFARPVPCTGALQVWDTDRLQTLVMKEVEHQLALTKVTA